MEDLESMSVKQLKEFIVAQGGSHSDCVEKSDLKLRAQQLQKAPAKDDFEDEVISSSDDEEDGEEEEGVRHASGKRFSVFRAKKFMTSKLVSGTSTGRATIMKVLGKDGDEVVQALQSICVKLTDLKTAKEMKKDAIRFLLKAYNLFKIKELTLESTKSIQTFGQMLAEMFVRESSKPIMSPRAPQLLSTASTRVHDACVSVLGPHLQPKNRDRLSQLLKFFATKDLFQALLTRADLDAEKLVLRQSMSDLLLPFTSLLAGDAERTKHTKFKLFLTALEANKFDSLMEVPQFTLALQSFLELEMGLTPRHVLRFLKSVEDYEKTTSKSLMRDRAPKISNRFLLASSEFSICDGVDPGLIAKAVHQANHENECNLHTFTPVVGELRRLLREDFDTQFIKTRDYQDLKAQVKRDIASLETLLVADGVL
ncbi:hypothetical protein BASA81_011305 [Batrachochytrium salamandrivorans]|nr:hypothetical protein BASA81_011305 [Batrachochytrium salamandrivorans]